MLPVLLGSRFTLHTRPEGALQRCADECDRRGRTGSVPPRERGLDCGMWISDCGLMRAALPSIRNPKSAFRNPRARYRGWLRTATVSHPS